MRILGLGGLDHDGSACVVEAGRVLSALELERVTRSKHRGIDAPDALAALLDRLDTDRIAEIAVADRTWFRAREPWLRPFLSTRFPGVPVASHDHHECHLACAFACSSFEQATVLSIDGKGDGRSMTAALATRNGGLTPLISVDSAQSLGRLWWAASDYAGLPGHHAAGKTMALAAYGEPRYLDALLCHVVACTDGSFRFEPPPSQPLLFRQVAQLVDWMTTLAGKRAERGRPEQAHCDLAASVQKLTELVVEGIVSAAIARTGIRDVCLAGGVALNGLANHRLIAQKHVDALFVPPCTDDRGLSIGAAALAATALGEPIRPVSRFSPFLGPLPNYCGLTSGERPAALYDHVAKRLLKGHVIGWFEGRDELGPRALGHRSILASPVPENMRGRINAEIKQRENFRPFGCSILREAVSDWFVCDEDSPYMLRIVPARAERRSAIPAVLHYDGTSRLHTVCPKSDPSLATLLKRLADLGHPPLILNTSFNGPGQPIVHTPEEAIDCARTLGLDALVLEDQLIALTELT